MIIKREKKLTSAGVEQQGKLQWCTHMNKCWNKSKEQPLGTVAWLFLWPKKKTKHDKKTCMYVQMMWFLYFYQWDINSSCTKLLCLCRAKGEENNLSRANQQQPRTNFLLILFNLIWTEHFGLQETANNILDECVCCRPGALTSFTRPGFQNAVSSKYNCKHTFFALKQSKDL